MKQIAQMLYFGMKSINNAFLFFSDVHFSKELFPVNQALYMEVAVVQEKINLFGC